MREQTFERKNVYKDFDMNFERNPLTDDIGVKNDVQAINQSLRNLINTNFYERPFRPTVGSNIRSILFEPADPITIDDLRQAITDTISNHEPRVEMTDLFVEDLSERNAYRVMIQYRVLPLDEISNLEIALERLR